MKKLLLALAMSAMTLNAYSGDVIVWNDETLTLHIPSINNQDGTQIFSSAKLIQRENGLFELTGLVPYVLPEENCSVDNGSSTPVGTEAFTNSTSSSLYVGDIYQTEKGILIEITGTTSSSVGCSICGSQGFSLAPDVLPEPSYGTKGSYYYMYEGDIAYADLL